MTDAKANYLGLLDAQIERVEREINGLRWEIGELYVLTQAYRFAGTADPSDAAGHQRAKEASLQEWRTRVAHLRAFRAEVARNPSPYEGALEPIIGTV